jgi:glucosamine 6-phosphate synthetase-like amidotransferase/phosphosugar isomerase protein
MCGIAGFSISDKDHRVIRTRLLSDKLLRQIQSRGRDATGAVWSENTEEGLELFYAKEPVNADRFVERNINLIPKYTRTALLHARYATKGSKDNPANNHPIVVPGVIGVHNGHISNDDEIFEALGVERIGQVDSEAIFQLLANIEDLNRLGELWGRAAIGWYEANDPKTMHLARLDGSPLWIGHTKNGSLVFASTKQILEDACRQAHVGLVQVWEVPEGMYLKVVKGEIVEKRMLALDGLEEELVWEWETPAPYRHLSLVDRMDRAYNL